MTKIGAQALSKEIAAPEAEETLLNVVDQLTQRIQSMEIKVDEQNARINNDIADIFEAVRLSTSNKRNPSTCDDHDQGSHSTSSPQVQGARNAAAIKYSGLAELEFPRFNRTKISQWLFKVDQFFSLDNTPEEMKVRLASFHLDELASTWHQAEFGLQCTQDWPSYKALLTERFSDPLDDPILELKQLYETNGIVEYQGKFELICTRLNLPEKYLVSAYLAGLRKDAQMHIRMFQPQTIRHCFYLGRLYEKAHPKKNSLTGGQQSRFNNGGDIAQISVIAVEGPGRDIGLQDDQSQESGNDNGTCAMD